MGRRIIRDVIYIFHYRRAPDKIFMDEITLRKRRLFPSTCMFNALIISSRLMSKATPTPRKPLSAGQNVSTSLPHFKLFQTRSTDEIVT